MSWFKVDDSLDFHPKARKAGNKAMGLWVRSGAYSARMLTEGLIEYSLISSLGGTKADARKLVEAGLWAEDAEAGGYRFHQWEQANPSRAEVLEARAAATERKRRQRQRVTSDVTRDSGGVSQRDASRARAFPDPTRPVSTSVAGQSSSSYVSEREIAEATTTDGHARWRVITPAIPVPAGVDADAEWERFLDHNAGGDVRNVRAAFVGWLRVAAERLAGQPRPTPTPDRPECPDHPGQPTGSVACPECAKVVGPPPAPLRALRDAG